MRLRDDCTKILYICNTQKYVPYIIISFVVDMTSAHGEEQSRKMFEVSKSKLDYTFRVMHMDFGRQWAIVFIVSGLNTGVLEVRH